MNTFADKQPENERSLAANQQSKKGEGKSTAYLQDNRPQSIVQKKQLEAISQQQAQASVIQQKDNHTGLPNQLKAGIENLSGHSMDDVKVHFNSAKPAQLQAHAYAQGSQIHLAPGQEKHLPHEAWHVVQQKQGRVKPTLQLKGININDSSALENEADKMGQIALQTKGDETSSKKTGTSHHTAPIQRAIKDELAQNSAAIDDLSAVDIDKVNAKLSSTNTSLSNAKPPKSSHKKAAKNKGVTAHVLKLLQEKNQLQSKQAELAKLKSEGNPEILKLEKLKAARAKIENKKKIVADVVKNNVGQKKPGWFKLDDDQLNTYTDKAFHLLEKIRHTDMTALMIAHQQVNDEAKATPKQKIKTLQKHIAYLTQQISALKAFDVDIPTQELKDTQKRIDAVKPTNKRPTGAAKKIASPIKLLSKRTHLTGEITRLQTLKTKGSPEIAKLDKLKQYKAKLHREHETQKKLVGKHDVNIDFLNTTETDDAGKDYIRAYMAIVAPNYDNKFKDFYLKNKDQLTYSANDRVMWVSFGTPFRTLSWFQKYAFEAKGDNVPLVRSFLLPRSYFDKHMGDMITEDPKASKGKAIRSHSVNIDLEPHFGPSKKGRVYKSSVNIIDPYLMNVDVKYPNQFALGRSRFAEEAPSDPGFFDATEADATAKKSVFEAQNYDQQIGAIEAKIAPLVKLKADIDNEEISNAQANEIIASHQKTDISGIKLADWFKTGYALDLPVFDPKKTVQAAKIMQGLSLDEKIGALENQLKALKSQKTTHEAVHKDIGTGSQRLQGAISGVQKEQEAQGVPTGMTSTLMSELIKNAIEGTFKTIALAGDRKHEHVSSVEGELEDINDFLRGLGLDYQKEKPSAHMLDETNTAFHNYDGKKWGSQTPEETSKIYSKMRFFYHSLDSQTQMDEGGPSKDDIAKVPIGKLDISKDSHLMKAIEQFGVNKNVNNEVKKLAQAYGATNVEEQLSVILNKNHLTPADAFGLPKDITDNRKDRFGNTMVKAAFETHFAKGEILSDASLSFIAGSVGHLISEIDTPTKATGLLKSIQENTYFKRDLQEILGTKASNGVGIIEEVPTDKETVLKVLNRLKTIKKVKDTHMKLRMVYLFFHLLRPYAQLLGNVPANKTKLLPHPSKHLKSPDLAVNNREAQLDDHSFLNPELKSFGIMDLPGAKSKRRDMPYDKFKSTQLYTAKSGSEMTDYMRSLDMPFIGGVSGTTRDQSQVLAHIFTKQTLEQNYWDFQRLNAAFMIGNSYHSFFETIYVAARYDKYTDKGPKILAEFDKMHGKSHDIKIYLSILKLIGADPDMEKSFTDSYAKMTQ
jgi:hypothetical protein